MITPISKKDNTTSIRAFVDDSNCIMLNLYNDRNMITQQLTFSAKQWEELLHTIGGKLEISKCKYVIITWHYDKNGTGILHVETESNSIEITDSESGELQNIQEITVKDHYKLLAVDMCINGDFTQQVEKLKEKIQKYRNVLQKLPLTPQEATIGVQGVIYPSVKYGLNATNIPWNDLDILQAPLTSSILSKIGYNQHMPREVVYAPI
jgi:hypothetical protein